MTQNNFNYIINNEENITAIIDGTVYTVSRDHLNYKILRNALRDSDLDTFMDHYDVKQSFVSRTGGKVTINGNDVFYNGTILHNSLTDRMLNLLDEGFDINPWILFLENLMQNPSSRAIEEAYNFLANLDMPITQDGYVLGFKGVRQDYYSVTAGSLKLLQGKTDSSGHVYNGIGEVIECERNAVDDNCNRTCSHGLHIGAFSYASTFGPKTVIVKFNPKDIISIPTDSSGQKCRACKYEVISDYVTNNNAQSPLGASVVNTSIIKLEEDEAYEFEYQDEVRRVVVLEKHPRYIHCRCLKGDKSESQYRNFDIDKISNVEVL
jgi:hypothetical protein